MTPGARRRKHKPTATQIRNGNIAAIRQCSSADRAAPGTGATRNNGPDQGTPNQPINGSANQRICQTGTAR